MTHVQLAGEGYRTGVIWRWVMLLFEGSAEDGGNGIFAGGTLTEHVFMSRSLTDTYAGDACALLPAIVLFFHQQVEFVERIIGVGVLIGVILDRLQQTDECYAALVL